ncbi:hypothetical protein BSZ35_00120 [Salinibacter sp. 10B]|uniref:Eco57I restriction-modification methylase domain-containing protein n=1 Tax=Salinibacter sp. 10B TaxID=1923971 RepID=UPI000CF4EBE9|nr:DNA methyltransferase [Salinibacter sp. 10B]PQJ36795.1 hypothetical protein BSZ35_00120 [Salinibacter sp. 10B]
MKQYPTITIQGNILSAELLGRLEQEAQDQTPGSFGIEGRVKDEIARAWGETKHQWQVFQSKLQRLDEDSTATSETRQFWILPFLDTLGYNLTYQPKAAVVQGETYDLSHRDESIGGFPVHVMGYSDSLERRREASGPRLSPHALVQEYLNLTSHLYALVTNGRQLRLLRDSSRLTRLTYLEFDLVQMMEDEVYADFAILYRLLHRSRMPERPEVADESIIEGYHQHALEQGARIRGKLSDAVKTGIQEMANALLQARDNADLRKRVAEGDLTALELYNQLLRFVYRLLFLFVIEERDLVFPDEKGDDHGDGMSSQEVYDELYAVSRLRPLAEQSRLADGRKHDLWLRVLNTFRLFEREDVGAEVGIAPLAGELFAPDALGALTDAVLDNRTLLHTLSRLTRFKNEQGVWTRVNYAALNVEEFGSVYEGLLEYEPVVQEGASPEHGKGWGFGFQEGEERDDTGSHYTPEELVRPLLENALVPVMEKKLNAAGDNPQEREEALLSLSVCDVACGSGHFLLAAARRIAFELAVVRTGEDQPSPEALRTAKRDVISRCIYGVDKNPMAVELCKVALWLEAHDPGKPLTFLDHRVRCGDAIIGVDRVDSFREGIPNDPFYKVTGDDNDVLRTLRKQSKEEREKRSASGLQLELGDEVSEELQSLARRFHDLEAMPDDTVDERRKKKEAFDRFQTDEWTRLKTLADAQVAPFFIRKTEENKDRVMTDGTFRRLLHGSGSLPDRPDVEAACKVGDEKNFFHWFLEFPEVFAEGGFDVILGNPPFLGNRKLKSTFGDDFLPYVKSEYEPAGATDLVAYFFRRIFDILNSEGGFGCIATNTIAQGSTREGGLAVILNEGGTINYAERSKKWPGKANLKVTLTTIQKGEYEGDFVLDGDEVDEINSYLSDEEPLPDPEKLDENSEVSFIGSVLSGSGFVLSEAEAEVLMEKNPDLRDVLFPYLIGDDLNSDPYQQPSRWVINFRDWPKSEAKKYPECFEIVEEKVKPHRADNNRKAYRKRWWRFAEPCMNLYRTIESFDRVLVNALNTKYMSFVFYEDDIVFSHMNGVFALDSYDDFAILQSNLHEQWAWKNASTLKGDLRYTPSKVFETFPFPRLDKDEETALAEVGQAYYEQRQAVMERMQLGLTKTYNLFHDPDAGPETVATAAQSDLSDDVAEAVASQIVNLRDLHARMDRQVLGAYGWNDIDLEHDFHAVDYLPEDDRIRYTISKRARKTVLRRLLELNFNRHAEEADVPVTEVEGHEVLAEKSA